MFFRCVIFCLAVVLGLSACVSPGQVVGVNAPAEVPVTVSAPVIVEEITDDRPAPRKQQEKEAIRQEKSVAIMVGSLTQRNNEIITAINKAYGGRAETFVLGRENSLAADVVDAVQDSSHDDVVGLGYSAALQAKNITGKRIALAEIFNLDDSNFSPDWYGVSMLPDPGQLFATWKALNPDIKAVAILTGPGFSQQLQFISAAAGEHHIQIIHRQVHNDKEMLFQSKLLMPAVQGFWLLPDYRVLSRRTMKEFMSLTLKKAKQVVVFNQQLLEYGGLIYIDTLPANIGKALAKQLENSDQSIVYTGETEIVLNNVIAQKLDLNIDEALRTISGEVQ